MIGYLSATTHDNAADSNLRAFREGLRQGGYVEGENIAVEYRWGEDRPDRLPVLAADLIRRRVNDRRGQCAGITGYGQGD